MDKLVCPCVTSQAVIILFFRRDDPCDHRDQGECKDRPRIVPKRKNAGDDRRRSAAKGKMK